MSCAPAARGKFALRALCKSFAAFALKRCPFTDPPDLPSKFFPCPASLDPRDLIDIGPDVELPLQPFGVHVADVAEDRALGPWAVVQAEHPADIGEGVGVAPVEEEA